MNQIPDGWSTLADLARERGVDKSAVSRRCTKFERLEILEARMLGRTKIVNREQFDRACAVVTDGIREMNGRSRRHAGAGENSEQSALALYNAQARRTRLAADLAQLRLDQAKGRLLPIADVEEAMARTAGELLRVMEAAPSHAAELTAAVAQDGELGARRFLKTLVRDFRERLAASMKSLVPDSAAKPV